MKVACANVSPSSGPSSEIEVSAGPTVQLAPPGAVIVTVRSAVKPVGGSAYDAYVLRSTKPPGRDITRDQPAGTLSVPVLLRLSVTTFDEATLGANRSYQWAMTLGYLGTPVLYLATLVLCVGLIASGILRRIGIVVGTISGLLFLVAYLPGVSDGMPPFTIALLWMPIGIGLLLRDRRRMAAPAIAPSAA